MIENITENLSTDIAATQPMDDAELQSIITQDLTDADRHAAATYFSDGGVLDLSAWGDDVYTGTACS